MDETIIAWLKTAVTAASGQIPLAPLGGVTLVIVGGGLHPLAAVVKLQT
jgi:hypothetical protein